MNVERVQLFANRVAVVAVFFQGVYCAVIPGDMRPVDVLDSLESWNAQLGA